MVNYAQRGCFVRVVYLILAIVCYVLSFGGRIGRGSVVVLCYHGIARDQRRFFARQMSGIAHRAVSLTGLAGVRSYRWGVMPRVCVTFDDGFQNLLENAIPVLEQLGVPATLFVVPGNWGRNPMWRMPGGHPEADERLMDEAQLQTLVKDYGLHVGSHTLTHTDLLSLSRLEVRRELSESKAVLENTLGVPVTAVAFPYGACNDSIVNEAVKVGYVSVCTLEPRLYRRCDGGRIGRFSMSPAAWPIEFHLTCAGAYSWLHLCRRLLAAGCARWTSLQRQKDDA